METFVQLVTLINMSSEATTMKSVTEHRDYKLMERALTYLQTHQQDQPVTAVLADHVGVSEGHLHRMFRRWVGLTPKQFLQTLTVERAKRLLDSSRSVLDTALDVGLSGPSRLHDHFVTLEAVTPAEYRATHNRLSIRWGFVSTPFGRAFVGLTERGICQLTFVEGDEGEDGLSRLQARWPNAILLEDQSSAREALAPLQKDWRDANAPIKFWVQGTNFQVQVWRALLRVPAGAVVDYSALAHFMGKPKATRAVASAIGANPIAFIIPCHRVIRRDGGLGGYRWGVARKSLLLAKELPAI